MKNRHLEEFSSFTGWGEEGNLIDEIDFKEFFESREKRVLSNK
jgi:hypothetical protein